MRWSWDDYLSFPDDYIEVVEWMAKEDYRADQKAAQHARPRGRRR